jgi:hypothetical protein
MGPGTLSRLVSPHADGAGENDDDAQYPGKRAVRLELCHVDNLPTLSGLADADVSTGVTRMADGGLDAEIVAEIVGGLDAEIFGG